MLLTFAIVDTAFKTLVVPAYLAAVGGSVSEMLLPVATVAAIAVAMFLVTVGLVARRIDRVIGADSRTELCRVGERLHRLPQIVAVAWVVEWVGFVIASTFVTGTWATSAAPVALFASTMVFAPLPLGYLITVFVSGPVVTRISLEARRRGIVIAAPSLSLRTQMVAFAVCVVLSPTFYVSSIAFAARITEMSIHAMWLLVLLFIAAATLYAVLNAAFFAAAMSSPIVQMTRIVHSIAEVGDVSNVERLPETRHDEIGELARWTNVMIDRLEQVETARATLTRTLENRVEERTRHLEKANEAVAHEMRARLKVELELRQAHKLEAVGRLAAGIAHEINTPIQFVSNNVDFAQRSLGDLMELVDHYRSLLASSAPHAIGEAARFEDDMDLEYLAGNLPTALDQAAMGLSRVTTIVRSMRRFARDDQASMTPVDINEALESTLVVTRHEYKDVAELETSFAPLPPVLCHPGELNQAFLNIIVNAAHAIGSVASASGQRGRLGVRTHLDGDAVQISISDSGGGIPEHARERIFDPFFTTKEIGKGTGQGLAIARAVVSELHDGDLRFETETGRGTTFFIRLPVDGGHRAHA
jgi:signal transduction histidine kinase